METHFYTTIFFSLFHQMFPMNMQKNKILIFFMPVRICTIMNAQKIVNWQGRQKRWKPTCKPWKEFFSFTIIFLCTFRTIPYYFLSCRVRISRIMNAKKSRNSRGKTRANGNPLLHHPIFIFFYKNFPVNMQSDSLLFFSKPCQYFYNNECKKQFRNLRRNH